ncbi:uncharacterized protein [Spinacia oleracea]|uniref:HAT C-terminal dimerisation domain-containing protein n=1 Tax=Spinacia oleracea TaxID=3562 RepID=A0ABM3RPK2_SPIOL|nr:uncharacterized protein LOC130471447 [Spinacia oleracea]
MEHSLSLSKVRGQGYDGASNMRGEINELKTLVMNDSPSAYYIHCFAHRLQLTLVAVAKENDDCIWLFEQLGYLLNVIGVSCKSREMLRVVQAQKVLEALECGEIESGQGLNQELGLGRPGQTRWGVLEMIGKNPLYGDDRGKAQAIMEKFESFEFIFITHLMLEIFGYTEFLSQSLQRKDQNIVNAMALVSLTKERLQTMRDHRWEIEVPDMDALYVPSGRSKRFFAKVTNLHRFRIEMFLSVIIEMFLSVIYLQLQELNNRFNEVNMELLLCMACLSPTNSFALFDEMKLIRLAKFYPSEFSTNDLVSLRFEPFIDDMRKDIRFREVKDLGELSTMLVETDKHTTYKLVYLLLRPVLILPVATASVERVFSSMTIVKSKLRNRLGDQLLNDCLVTFIERGLSSKVSDEDVINRFQNMKSRRMQI